MDYFFGRLRVEYHKKETLLWMLEFKARHRELHKTVTYRKCVSSDHQVVSRALAGSTTTVAPTPDDVLIKTTTVTIQSPTQKSEPSAC